MRAGLKPAPRSKGQTHVDSVPGSCRHRGRASL